MSLHRLRQVLTLGALALALAHLIRPTLAIDPITVVLLIVAVVPWLAPLFRSLEFPGGWKIEFQELQKATDKADAAGLLAPATAAVGSQEYSPAGVATQDPNLALAGLRIEIERRLRALASAYGLEVSRAGIAGLLRELTERQILDRDDRSVLLDIVGLLNRAVHGAKVEPAAADWAMTIGAQILAALDQRIRDAKK